MAEGYSTDQYPDQTPGLSMDMDALAIQDKTEMHANAVSLNLASLPVELIHQMVGHLPPAHDTAQVGGSDALRSAQAGLGALRALCQVSRQMRAVVEPHIYRTIVVSDPYKLHHLRQTLDKSPELGQSVKSLTVYRDLEPSDIKDQRLLEKGHHDPQIITLSQFCETLVAVLKRTPHLVTFSLNFDKTAEAAESDHFHELKKFLPTEISRAQVANGPQNFLPEVVTLGILFPKGGPSRIDRNDEYQTFGDLLNLPSLSHIVVRRPGPGSFTSHEIYGEFLSQRQEALRHTITSIDLQVGRTMSWDDIGGITAMFPALSSLVLSHNSHAKSQFVDVAPGWSGLIRMECLRHLSIDIESPVGWPKCTWFTDAIKYRFHFAPMLETLRIPMRLLRNPSLANGAMLDPREVLPETLQSLVLIADFRVFPLGYAYGEDIAPVEENYQDQGIQMPYVLGRHMAYPFTFWFLRDIEKHSQTYFPQLNILCLEYQTNLVNQPGFADVNQVLNSSEGWLVSNMEALQGTMEQKGIQFSFTRL